MTHIFPRLRNALAAIALVAPFVVSQSGRAQEAVIGNVVVAGEEVPSAYGAPPGSVYAGLIYQGDALRFNRPDHMFTQEIEVGLPYRFGLAIENSVETFRGTTQDRTFSIEARYAFADWNKILLNPTIFVEWKFGIGNILHDEGPPEPLGKGEALAFLNERNPLPDAFEVRLLLSQEFFGKLEWALNGFFEQEVGGDRGREYGFAQSAMIPILLPNERLKVGVEMQLTTFTDKGIRDMPSYRFIVGPTIAWKPTANTRFDVSPLIGATDDAPRISVFAVFSMLFGPGGEEKQAAAPASTRNR